MEWVSTITTDANSPLPMHCIYSAAFAGFSRRRATAVPVLIQSRLTFKITGLLDYIPSAVKRDRVNTANCYTKANHLV
ncbi:hypothetical protein SODG_000910 [Sodalis praecaptivus]|nr:hypothetical protein NVIRENTERO_00230 [Sodalis praecaptivus]